MTDETRVVRYLRAHPGSSPKEVAAALYVPPGEPVTVGHACGVGTRLSRLAANGLLTRTFDRGWRYRVKEEAEESRCGGTPDPSTDEHRRRTGDRP